MYLHDLFKVLIYIISQLLELENSVTVHYRIIQILATDIFKGKKTLAPIIMKQVYDILEPSYNFNSRTRKKI